jgi:hypothetical protein
LHQASESRAENQGNGKLARRRKSQGFAVPASQTLRFRILRIGPKSRKHNALRILHERRAKIAAECADRHRSQCGNYLQARRSAPKPRPSPAAASGLTNAPTPALLIRNE